jgi:hypothetical protein
MSQTERNKRLRLLVKQLNKQRKQQASKTDILCNDLINAQRSFIDRLQDVVFAAEFYRSLLGSTELTHILMRAGRVLRQELPGADVTFFVRQSDGCELHAYRGDESLYGAQDGPQECFDPELVENICKYNKPCRLDEMLRLGLDGEQGLLSRFSLVTLPLTDLGRSLGFVLIYCPLPQVVTAEEVRRIGPVMCGLAQAVRSARVPLPSGE